MNAGEITFVTRDDIRTALPFDVAINALEAALREGLDPASMPPRRNVDVEAGEFLIFPAEYASYISIKILGLAPDNPAAGLPKVQGYCILWDAKTLTPVAIVEGSALTAVRTAALSALGVRHLATQDAGTLMVFGTGPQAYSHVEAITKVRHIKSVITVGRTSDRSREFADALRAAGHNAFEGSPDAVGDADIVACCTTSEVPLFDGSLVRDDAVVVAMGSHDARYRETDDALVSRSTVWVEDIDSALAGAGDVVQPFQHGLLRREELYDLRSLVTDGRQDWYRPALFKTIGMGWQDVVTAKVVLESVRGY